MTSLLTCTFPSYLKLNPDCDVTNRGFIIMTRYQNNSQVCGTTRNHHHPKKSSSSLSAGNVMLLLFFHANGIILHHWVPRGQTVKGVLKTHLRGAMRKNRPDLHKKQWFLLQDNAWPHIAAVAWQH